MIIRTIKKSILFYQHFINCFIISIILLITICTNPGYSQWVQSNGPTNSNVTYFEKCGNKVFAATSSGLYASTDSGQMWSLIYGPGLSIESIVVKDSSIFISSGASIIRSDGNGLNWNKIDYSFAGFGKWVSAIAIIDSTIIAAQLTGHIYSSTDFGRNWNYIKDIGLTSVYCMRARSQKLYAGTENGLKVSTDKGYSWTPVINGLGTSDRVSKLYCDSSFMFAGVYGKGVFMSTDNGSNWVSCNNGLTNLNVNALERRDSNLYAATQAGVFVTGLKELKWSAFNNGLLNTNTISLCTIGNILICGTTKDINILSNTNNIWQPVKKGLVILPVSSISIVNDTIYAGSKITTGIYVSSNKGINWNTLSKGFQEYYNTKAVVADSNYLFAGTYNGVYTSTDRGASWTNSLSGSMLNTLVKIDKSIFASILGEGLRRSNDYCKSWVKVNDGLVTASDYSSKYIYTVANSGTNIYAGSQAGVFISSNMGDSWRKINEGITDIWIISLAAKDSLVVAGTGYGKVFLSTNCGANWTNISCSQMSGWVNSICFYKNNIFASNTAGLFQSTNFGKDWIKIDDSNFNMTYCTAFDNTYIYAGTDNGIWKRPLIELANSVEKIDNNIPDVYTLKQNYPNPINPVTKIEFSLPKESAVKVKIYDILGREVNTLINEKLSAGSYSVEWNSAGLCSGVYIYTLQAGSTIISRKMNLLK